jgi:hypothetical protein
MITHGNKTRMSEALAAEAVHLGAKLGSRNLKYIIIIYVQ